VGAVEGVRGRVLTRKAIKLMSQLNGGLMDRRIISGRGGAVISLAFGWLSRPIKDTHSLYRGSLVLLRAALVNVKEALGPTEAVLFQICGI